MNCWFIHPAENKADGEEFEIEKADNAAERNDETVVSFDSDDNNEGKYAIENLINDTAKQEIQGKEKLDSNEMAKLTLAEINSFIKESDDENSKEIALKPLEELNINNIVGLLSSSSKKTETEYKPENKNLNEDENLSNKDNEEDNTESMDSASFI